MRVAPPRQKNRMAKRPARSSRTGRFDWQQAPFCRAKRGLLHLTERQAVAPQSQFRETSLHILLHTATSPPPQERKTPPVGEHPPHPLQRAKVAAAQPPAAEQCLYEPHAKGHQHHPHKPCLRPKAKADAIKQEHSPHRLANIIGERHAPRGGKEAEKAQARPAQVQQADGCHVGKARGVDAREVEKAVGGVAPGMAFHGTPRINHGEGQPQAEAHPRHAQQQPAAQREVGVQPAAAYPEANDKESEHLEVSVAVDELLHAHQRALHEELQHAAIPLGVAQPVGKIVCRDTVAGALPLLQAHHPGRQAHPGGLASEIDRHRHKQQRPGPREQRAVRGAAQQRQEHTHKGVEHQYVATPDEHQVQETYANEYGHAAVEYAQAVDSLLLGIGNYYREADAEEQREDGVELAVYEHVLQEPHHLVCRRRVQRRGGFGLQECVEGKLREVCHGDAHEGEAAQDVEYGETLLRPYGHGRAALSVVVCFHLRICIV